MGVVERSPGPPRISTLLGRAEALRGKRNSLKDLPEHHSTDRLKEGRFEKESGCAGAGRPGVSILCLGEMERLICNFYLNVAASEN